MPKKGKRSSASKPRPEIGWRRDKAVFGDAPGASPTVPPLPVGRGAGPAPPGGAPRPGPRPADLPRRPGGSTASRAEEPQHLVAFRALRVA